MKFVLHAPNVHQGGGRTLLVSLLRSVKGFECVAIVDQRLSIPDDVSSRVRMVQVPPTVVGRLRAEMTLASLSKPGDIVLCFGNLPPLFKNRGRVSVFLQNRYLLRERDLCEMPLRQRFRVAIERRWLRCFLYESQLIVQTDSMAREVKEIFGSSRARVMPFFPLLPLESPIEPSAPKKYDFIYVASGEPHKNHRRLVQAWEILGTEGIYPSLCLTLDSASDRQLLDWIDFRQRSAPLRITNVGQVSQIELSNLYRASRSLIYPSLFESFGLPLIEAASYNLPIVAPELDYVRDVASPAYTFDPSSAVSLARAVKRALGISAAPSPTMLPEEFLGELLNTRDRN